MTSKSGKRALQAPSKRVAATDSASLLDGLKRLYPREIDLSLDRIERLLTALGNPETALAPVIHVAGTNGKGSVIAFLQAILEAAGQRVHTLTSPHLIRFHERIQLSAPEGAQPIDEGYLIDILSLAEAANAEEPITIFEITTAAAFLAFAETPADFVLLETGLGGRLDATNVIAKPLASLITQVSIDHTRHLGSSLAEIAYEKAGIIKRDVPCVVAPQEDEALAVIEERAESLSAPLFVSGREWQAHEQHSRLIFQTAQEFLDLPLPRLQGRHQIDNAGCAIAAARICLQGAMPQAALAVGLENARWPARLDRLTRGPLLEAVHPQTEIWLDGGHNPAAAIALALAMAELEERVPRPLHLICAMMLNKDAHGFFEPFQGLCQWVGSVPIPGSANAFQPGALADIAGRLEIPTEPFASLDQALAASSAIAGDEPVRVLIAGSLYLAGHVLEQQARAADSLPPA